MRSLHAAAVTRNVERSADETAEGSHNCGEIVPPLGAEPTKLDQRVDRAALDFEHEADFAWRAQRRGYAHLDRPLDELGQRMGEGLLVAIGCAQPAQVDQIGSLARPHTPGTRPPRLVQASGPRATRARGMTKLPSRQSDS